MNQRGPPESVLVPDVNNTSAIAVDDRYCPKGLPYCPKGLPYYPKGLAVLPECRFVSPCSQHIAAASRRADRLDLDEQLGAAQVGVDERDVGGARRVLADRPHAVEVCRVP
jgi:hypothetical protein